MKQCKIDEQKAKKKWHKPSIEMFTSDELKKLVVSGACSVYIGQCEVFRIGR